MSKVVPTGWQELEVQEAFNLGRGRVISKPEIRDNPGQYPVYSSQSKDNGKMGQISTYDFDGEYITWTTDGAYAGTVFHREGRFNCTNVCGTLKDNGNFEVHPRFVASYLETVAKGHVSYVGNPKLMNGTFAEIQFLLPPLPEQQKIAAILSSVDDVIEKTQAQIDKLKDLKAGMMQELLSPTEGSRQSKAMGHTEFKDSPVGRIPIGWDVVPISAICTHIVDCVNKTAPVVDSVTPFKMIRTTNVRDGKVDTDNVRYVAEETYKTWTRRLLPENGDLIFTREAPVGECGILKNSKGVFLGQRTMMYRSNLDKVVPNFLMYSLQSEYCQAQIEDFSGGSTVPHMRVPDCEKILIKTPSLQEQHSIAKSIDGVVNLISAKEEKLQMIGNAKKALMQDLLSGKVRVQPD